MMFRKGIFMVFIFLNVFYHINSQNKGFSVEVYPSELEEDNSIVAGDDLYRANLRSMWNNVNPYYGYTNNPYMTPPYMPMYGYNQPVMAGNYYMGMAGQRSYNTPNPQNFNYPKLMHMKGDYPKFKEKSSDNPRKNSESSNLAKELEKQIKELQILTKEAKELAKKKIEDEKKNKFINNNTVTNNSNNSNMSDTTVKNISSTKRLRRSNLDQLSLEPKQKIKFDEGIKKIINKLDKL